MTPLSTNLARTILEGVETLQKIKEKEMEKLIIAQSIEFSPNQRKIIKLEPNCFISHIDASLTARIKSTYNSMPRRTPLTEGEIESIPRARKTAFSRLIADLMIGSSNTGLVGVRYLGRWWFLTSWLAKKGKIKTGRLPMWGHTKKIVTDFVIHFGFLELNQPGYYWDITVVLPTSKYDTLTLDWSDSLALGENYEIEWATLKFTFYQTKLDKEELKEMFPPLTIFPNDPSVNEYD